MAARGKIEYSHPDELYLDPLNPRLGRRFTESKPNQSQILDQMKFYTLDELAVSIIESGFWNNEPLIVVNEKLPNLKDSRPRRIVVEGNRRLATAKLLLAAHANLEKSKKWLSYAASASPEVFEQLQELPFIVAKSRGDVDAYLGFRHVTGIKQWSPTEKAEFIEKLIDSGKTYSDVRRMIGSTIDAVRRNYIAFKLVKQMEDVEDGIPVRDVEDRFSLLALGLRTRGIQDFLGIDGKAEPVDARTPVSRATIHNLKDFALWAFGNKDAKIAPVLPESRDMEDFAKILESTEAVAYMRQVKNPTFDVAFRIAGGDANELLKSLNSARYELQKALAIVHHHKQDEEVAGAVDKLAADFGMLLVSFPDCKSKHFSGVGNA